MKIKLCLASLIVPAIMLVSCNACSNSGDSPNDGPDTPDKYKSYTRVALASTIEGVQPMTGIVLWSTSGKRNTDAISLEYSYMVYSDIVSVKGVYDWSTVETMLDGVASRGHQGIIRFRYTYPGKTSGVPEYIKAEDDYEVLWADSEGRNTEFPDWRCAELQRFHLEFYEKFAEKYDNDPRLAFLQTGFGLWGEYHIYDGPFMLGQTFPSKEFQKEFVVAMGEYFKKTPWSISIDASSSSYGPFKETGNEGLKDEKFGLFDDSFMHKSHNSSNETWWKYFEYTERYKTSPHGGEFSYYTKSDQQNVLNPEGMHGRIFEEQAAKFHITYMIGNDQPGYQTMARIKEASMACGYRYTVKDFRVSGNNSVVCIANTGVAPIYRDAYVAVNGTRGAVSLKSLIPGEEVWIEVASGGTAPVLAIECDHLVAGQKIEFEVDVK